MLSWIILLFLRRITANEDLFLHPPTIEPDESYVTLEYNTNFSFTCTSDYQVTWKSFKNFKGFAEINHFEIEGRYHSTINLISVNYNYVGFYYCVAKTKEMAYDYSLNFLVEHRYQSQISGLKEIYVFVNDFGHLLANKNHPETTIFRNEHLIVPCKPTMSSVHVKLHVDTREITDASYDKTIGFIIKSTNLADYYDKTFTCTSSPPIDENNYNITFKVERRGDESIEMFTPNEIDKMEISSSELVAVWKIQHKGMPRSKLVWYDSSGRTIEESDKYEMTTTKDLTTLRINYLGFTDSGNYTLTADNVTEKTLELVVNEAPIVDVRGPQLVKQNEMAEFVCYSAGFPPSTITWTFTPCDTVPSWPTCEVNYFPMEGELTNTTSTQKSILRFNATKAGKLECTAVNNQGKIKSEILLKVTDIEQPFFISELGDNFQIPAGDNLTITCGASVYTYSDVHWYLSSVVVPSSSDQRVKQNDTKYSYRKTITWNGIKTIHSGTYECRATKYHDILPQPENRILKLDVREPRKPKIKGSSVEDHNVPLGTVFRMTCDFVETTFPHPEITWSKNGTSLLNDSAITFSDDMKDLTINRAETENGGTFLCLVANKFGSTIKSINLKIIDSSLALPPYIIFGIILLVLTVICIISSAYFYFRFKRLRHEFKAGTVIDFGEGNLIGLNPDLALHEQADLLPYNKRYEFPKDKLKLGKQLGSGAFGVVAKAVAIGILPYEEETIVAVKMLQKTADILEIRALVTELKIMANLGQNVNVVNLLGAITKNIERREIMVIVEYCRFGNVQNFLIKHRQYFINQINPENGSIDTSILTKEERSSNRTESEHSSLNSSEKSIPRYQNVARAPSSSTSETYLLPLNSSGSTNSSSSMAPSCSRPSFDNSVTLSNNSAVTLSNNSAVTLSNNSAQSVFCNGPIRYITTTDLLCWSFQVARGMNYLSSRKVLHGDLAARNVLLCNDNVVKICDFGLARSLYKCNNYKKEGAAPLPFKWLAIESISDQVFSTLSDVWSFGIVMWELFSLGTTPYPGMEANQDLFYRLKNGYRMDKPERATKELYDIMMECWNVDPESRPLFHILEEKLRKVLGIGLAQHYVNLNEQYIEMNAHNVKQGEIDYLTIGEPVDPVHESKGYLPMKPIIRSAVSNTGDVDNASSNAGYISSQEIN